MIVIVDDLQKEVNISKEELRQYFLVRIAPEIIIKGRLSRLGRSHDLRILLHIGEKGGQESGEEE